MRKIKIIVFVLSLMLIPTLIYANGSDDFLILQDIGPYKISKPEKLFPGEPPIGGPRTYDSHGIIGATGHFPDHINRTYEVMYLGEIDALPSPTVQVTQHAGSDSDKWLLHEVESSFRGREKEGWLGQGLRGSTSIREINGNLIFDYGNIDYRWLSNNVVVYIHYTDLAGTKSEPLEVVQAYLTKFPSTITLTDTEIKSTAHNEKWIKDEMDRRLWLGGKWMGQIKTAGDLDKLRDVVKSLNVFLDYREKYFGIETGAEKNALFTAQQSKNKAAIEDKLNDYFKWWNENKDKPVNL